MFPGVDVEPVCQTVGERTLNGLVEAMSRLIREGIASPGERLPTVRSVAAALGMGVATVSAAWGRLAEAGMIETRGRAGSFVAVVERRTAARFFRYSRHGEFRLDLSSGLPDPDLIPGLDGLLGRWSALPHPSSYIAEPVIPELEEQIRAGLPYDPQAVTVVDGALDALDRLLSSWVRLGDRVAVADPGFPPTFDLIEANGGKAVPVELDEEGMVPDSLARALAGRPVAVVVQPRAHNPTGVSMSDPRRRELAEMLLAHPEVVIIEDDHSGPIAASDLVTLATDLPDRVVHITSYSKSHGPDLRIASVAGPSDVIDRVVDRRRLGPAWTSRFLQQLLAALLVDPPARRQVEEARKVYSDRRAKLAEALAERGIQTDGRDGLNLWVPVPDEQAALVALASHGIAVAPGRPFQLRPTFQGHVRITTGSTGADLTEVADLLAG